VRRGEDIGPLLARKIVPFAQPGTWFRMSLYERLGGFDEGFKLAGDLDFFSRALENGARFEFVSSVVAGFRLRPGQLSKDESTGDAERDRALRQWIGTRRSIGALLRFRCDNLPAYLDRMRRHGLVRMRSIYRQER